MASTDETIANQPSEKRRRIRPFKSCTFCRQRKIKCDRQRPFCAECVKRNRRNQCHYPDSTPKPVSESQENNDEAQSIAIGLDGEVEVHTDKDPDWVAPPYVHCEEHHKEDDIFSFYQNTFSSPVMLSQAPLSWLGLFRKDLFLHAIVVTERPKTASIKLNSMRLTSEDDEFFQKWSNEHLDHAHEPIPGSSKKRPSLFKKLYAEFTMDEDYFLEKVTGFLKDEKLVRSLISRFFTTEFYILLSFFDETDFRLKLASVLSYQNGTPILKFENSSELALLGSLLLIMRIASVGLYNFSKPFSDTKDTVIDHETEYLQKNLVSKEIVPFIEKIQFEFITYAGNGSPSLEVFQFLLTMAHYNQFAPESSDCVNSVSSLRFSDLVNYALQCCLERDPSQTNTTLLNEHKDNNLLRRLWYGLINLDMLHYILLGPSLVIDTDSYNTKLPVIDESKTEMEILCNKWIVDQWAYYSSYIRILKVVLNLRNPPHINVVLEELEVYDRFVSSLKKFEDIVEAPSNTVSQRGQNIKDFLVLHDSHSLLFMIYFHLFIHFSKAHNDKSSFHYLKKMLDIYEILYKSILFLDPHNSKFNFFRLFGSGVIVFPRIEASLHRVHQLSFAIVGRIKAYILYGTETVPSEVVESIQSIMESISKLVRHNLSNYVRVSYTYYHTWIICKVQALILHNTLSLPLTYYQRPSHPRANNGNIIKFISIINKHKGYDYGFKNYSIEYFQDIAKKFVKIAEISEYNEPSSHDLEQNIEPSTTNALSGWNLDTVLENDNIWLDRMMREYNPGATSDNSTKRSSTFSPSLNKLKLSKVDAPVRVGAGGASSGATLTSNAGLTNNLVGASIADTNSTIIDQPIISGVPPPGSENDLIDLLYNSNLDLERLLFQTSESSDIAQGFSNTGFV